MPGTSVAGEIPECSPPVAYTLRRSADLGPRGGDEVPETRDDAGTAGGRSLVCAACGHRITSQGERIEVGGGHDHRFFNPAGFLFHLGCFARAAGCTCTGTPTTEFSWFAGFAWRHALCGDCGEHLGWHFGGSEGRQFFGLVLNRLADG